MNEKFIFFLLLAIFPLGQLLRLTLPGFPQIKLQALDLLVFWFVLSWLSGKLLRKEKFALPPLFKPLAVFGGIASLSLILKLVALPFSEILPASLYLLRLLSYLAFYWAVWDFLKKENLPIFKYLIWEGVAIGFLAIVQYLALPDTRFLFNLGWDEHYFRAIGSFLDPAFTGLLLILSWTTWLAEILNRKGKINPWQWPAGLLILFAVALSFSRVSYLVLIIATLILLFLNHKLKALFLILLGFLFLVFLLPKPGGEGVNLLRTNSFWAKTANYRQTFQIIKDNFWLGVGFNAFRLSQKNYGFIDSANWQLTNAGAGADNSFLFVWATTGVFGLLAFLFLWLKILKGAEPVVLVTGAALIISSFSVNALFYPWVLFWLMLILAKTRVET